MTTGQTFINGATKLHARGFNWAELLTVVRRDAQSYGVDRYIVRDRNGRHGYAY